MKETFKRFAKDKPTLAVFVFAAVAIILISIVI